MAKRTTPEEAKRICELFAAGLTRQQISIRTGISYTTVKKYIQVTPGDHHYAGLEKIASKISKRLDTMCEAPIGAKDTVVCHWCKKPKERKSGLLRPNGHFQCGACHAKIVGNLDPGNERDSNGQSLEAKRRGRAKNNPAQYAKNLEWWRHV